MEIKTKYNIGDEVWWIDNNKVHQDYVKGIFFSMYGRPTDYTLYYKLNQQLRDFDEEILFPTKEELLKSL